MSTYLARQITKLAVFSKVGLANDVVGHCKVSGKCEDCQYASILHALNLELTVCRVKPTLTAGASLSLISLIAADSICIDGVAMDIH
jgi:hypothetical protein